MPESNKLDISPFVLSHLINTLLLNAFLHMYTHVQPCSCGWKVSCKVHRWIMASCHYKVWYNHIAGVHSSRNWIYNNIACIVMSFLQHYRRNVHCPLFDSQCNSSIRTWLRFTTGSAMLCNWRSSVFSVSILLTLDVVLSLVFQYNWRSSVFSVSILLTLSYK